MSDYLAHPQSRPNGGMLVLHTWWGPNEFFRGFCDRLAEQGLTVLAPDLYNGAVARTIPEARKLRAAIDRDTESKHILQALKQLRNHVEEKPIALIGFSMGAFWALKLFEERPKDFAATVLFYGTRGGEYAGAKSVFLGHFADDDEFVAESGRRKLEKTLKKRGNEVSFIVYPKTRHWFFEKDRPEYDPQAAALAWSRTIEFLNKTVS